MIDYKEKMLRLLVEKYRKSKKDSKTNVICRRTGISPSELYKKYSKNDGDMDQIENINQAAAQCAEEGFLTFEENGFSNEIARIYLNDEKVDEIETYLESAYGYEPKRTKRQYVEQMIARYSGISPAADRECERLKRILAENKIPNNYQQTEEILKALTFIERNKRQLYVREASMMIYGSSKYLEENTLERVCRLLRAYKKRPCKEDELVNEILQDYSIIPERQKICLKGDITLKIGGRLLELGSLGDGIEFFTEDLEALEQVSVHTVKFMTVENKTSYYRCRDQAVSFFYLGGYATRFQRDFLKKVYHDNPAIQYLHFGDLDAGGFYIHENLCRITGIPFGLYRMSEAELKKKEFSTCCQPLTDRDRKRLNSLADTELYGQTVRYMLDHNVKLEQEIISYREESY
ncbi:MAG: Wadjet anti-phage system protein JetD domain-containing protein [Lachnospiraceae bacterium]